LSSIINIYAQDSIMEIPTGKGFPVSIKTGVSFIDIESLDENAGKFTATIDIRLKWTDLRLQFPKNETIAGYKDYKNADAEQKLSEIWTPDYDLANIDGEPWEERYGLRIYHTGEVELLRRMTAVFDVIIDVARFPFDKQYLSVEIKSHKEVVERLSFDFSQEELNFSKAHNKIKLISWTPSIIQIKKENVVTWHGEKNSQIKVSLAVDRIPGSVFGTIFLPLIASLLIPLFAVWLNKFENGEFKVEATEMTNLNIGGLFAVVALNFTVASTYLNLSEVDNCVMQLFTLNYLVLAVSFAINIFMYRLNVVGNKFGNYVQAEFFKYLNWAFPVIVFVAGIAIVLNALF